MPSDSFQLLFMTHEFAPRRGGIATYVEGMARAAADLGIPTQVWADGAKTEADKEFPFKVVRLGTQGNQGWPDRLRLAASLREIGHDWGRTILCLPEPAPLRMWFYEFILNLPKPKAIVPIFHGTELNLIQNWPPRRKLFETFLVKTDRIGVVSHFVKGLLNEELIEGHPIEVVPGAPLNLDKQVLKTAYPKDGPFKLLSLARIQKRKGQLDLVKAMEVLPVEERQEFKITLAGRIKDNSYQKEIEKKSKELGLDLEFQGEVSPEDLETLYQESDLLVFPSKADAHRVEGLGLVILEAALRGVPTLGSLHGGIPEAIRHGETGWLCDTVDASVFAQQLLELKENRESCRRCGEQANAWVRESFSYERNVRKLFRDWFPQLKES